MFGLHMIAVCSRFAKNDLGVGRLSVLFWLLLQLYSTAERNRNTNSRFEYVISVIDHVAVLDYGCIAIV
jgi:hypothetical protein